MPTLLTAVSDQTLFQLIELSIRKHVLLDEDEGSKDILLVFLGNVIVMYIVANLII